MGSPYRHHRSVWREKSRARPYACLKVAINFSGRIAPRSLRSSGFLQNEEIAGDAAICPNLLSDEDLALLVAQPDDTLPRQIAEAVNDALDALEINGGKGKPAPTGLAQ